MSGPKTPKPGSRPTLHKGWVTLPAGGRSGDPPVLSVDVGPRFEDRAAALWGLWWRSPMALMWSEFDIPALERLLLLTAQTWSGVAIGAIFQEVRQLEDRFGLNPVARRKLYWRIEGVDTTAKEPERQESSGGELPKSGGAADPRLRVVNGGKAG